MPFALIFAGAIMLISAVRGTEKQLGTLVKQDFSGPGNFLYWFLGIVAAGSIGYIKQFETSSRYLILFMLIAFLISNRRGIASLPEQLSQATSTSNVAAGDQNARVVQLRDMQEAGQEQANAAALQAQADGAVLASAGGKGGGKGGSDVIGDIAGIAGIVTAFL